MYTRQAILLHLIKNAGGKISRLNLVKLAFLFANEVQNREVKSFYQFVPFRFGPFSFTMYHELDALIRDGYILSSDDHEIALNQTLDENDFYLNLQLKQEICRLWLRYCNYDTSKLIEKVYSQYPWFTLLSENLANRLVERPKVECTIYTVGYEGLQVDGFLNLLLKSGIRKLIDVRSNPISRHYGFHKKTLLSLCEKLNIVYIHIPEAGIPHDLRVNLNKLIDYENLFIQYENEMLKDNVVQRVAELIAIEPSVLVCQELNPLYCHRARLAKKISNLTGKSVKDLRVENGEFFKMD